MFAYNIGIVVNKSLFINYQFYRAEYTIFLFTKY